MLSVAGKYIVFYSILFTKSRFIPVQENFVPFCSSYFLFNLFNDCFDEFLSIYGWATPFVVI